jgi:hypothetical protein
MTLGNPLARVAVAGIMAGSMAVCAPAAALSVILIARGNVSERSAAGVFGSGQLVSFLLAPAIGTLIARGMLKRLESSASVVWLCTLLGLGAVLLGGRLKLDPAGICRVFGAAFLGALLGTYLGTFLRRQFGRPTPFRHRE